MKYVPYHLYMNGDGTEQCWDEMAMGSWWWDFQVRPIALSNVSISDANQWIIRSFTQGCDSIAHHTCKQQDLAHNIQKQQAGMAHLSHSRSGI